MNARIVERDIILVLLRSDFKIKANEAKMAWPTRMLVALVALLAQDASAQTGSARGSDFLRFGCSQLVVERTDPLVNPGMMPTPHMHQVVGGDSFNITVCSLLPSSAAHKIA